MSTKNMKELRMDDKTCACCGENKIDELNEHDIFSHFICRCCGYEYFVNRHLKVEPSLYENDSDYNDDLSVSEDYNALIQWNHKKAINYLRGHDEMTGASVLDIGCFNGFFVKKLLELGFDAYGIDFNEKAIEFGQSKYGLSQRISCDRIEVLVQNNKKYDVVTMFEVIEHLESSPNIFLKTVTNLLKDGGTLIVSTPNSNMLWRPMLDFPPHHFSRFTPKSLNCCLSLIGLKPVKTLEQMSTFDLGRNYIGATFFRQRNCGSLRGGKFKNKRISDPLRLILNKAKWAGYFFLYPIDRVMHFLGFRYIGQLVISEKKVST